MQVAHISESVNIAESSSEPELVECKDLMIVLGDIKIKKNDAEEALIPKEPQLSPSLILRTHLGHILFFKQSSLHDTIVNVVNFT